MVVVGTTKVQFFKQITTTSQRVGKPTMLLLIPQRYNFSSKSQLHITFYLLCKSCCWYHKGTIFQANHNESSVTSLTSKVVVDTTKVQFFKQITTLHSMSVWTVLLLLIPQRYNFSSKSQRDTFLLYAYSCCCWYHKGTIFQANHNRERLG